MTRVSVVIVSFNAPFFLQICLESVRAALGRTQGEAIVVDNASREGCVEMIRSEFPEFQLIVNEQNMGFSKAVNQGVSRATGEHILILNPDSVLPENSLEALLEFATGLQRLGAVGCRFIDGRGVLLPECKRNFPGMRAAAFKLFGLNRGYYATGLGDRDTGEVEVLTGAFMFMKRDLFEQMEGFDESFFMYGEDIDLSYRIQSGGFRNLYLGSLTMVHFKGESSVKNTEYLKHFYGALRTFYLKHYKDKPVGRAAMNALVEIMVWFRSLAPGLKKPFSKDPSPFVYIGHREEVYASLRHSFTGLDSQWIRDVQAWIAGGHRLDFQADLSTAKLGVDLFFDPKSLSYASIVDCFDLLPSHFRKRIISESGDFYVGSDDPRKQGQKGLLGRPT